MSTQESSQTNYDINGDNIENNIDKNVPPTATPHEATENNAIVQELTEQVEQLKDKLLRQLAETENLRTRSTKLVTEAKDYAIFSFCQDIVNVMDNLSRALEHLPSELSPEINNVIEGIKMTQNELVSVFHKHSLESITPKPGDRFDYNMHHAISHVITEEFEPGSIVHIMQVGYKVKDRLIRPAAVAVAKKQ